MQTNVAGTTEQLYNCCPGNSAPDFSQFDALEIGGCVSHADSSGETMIEGGIEDSKAEFWTVYGHLRGGGLEAITDCPTRESVDKIADELSLITGLPVTIR